MEFFHCLLAVDIEELGVLGKERGPQHGSTDTAFWCADPGHAFSGTFQLFLGL